MNPSLHRSMSAPLHLLLLNICIYSHYLGLSHLTIVIALFYMLSIKLNSVSFSGAQDRSYSVPLLYIQQHPTAGACTQPSLAAPLPLPPHEERGSRSFTAPPPLLDCLKTLCTSCNVSLPVRATKPHQSWWDEPSSKDLFFCICFPHL